MEPDCVNGLIDAAKTTGFCMVRQCTQLLVAQNQRVERLSQRVETLEATVRELSAKLEAVVELRDKLETCEARLNSADSWDGDVTHEMEVLDKVDTLTARVNELHAAQQAAATKHEEIVNDLSDKVLTKVLRVQLVFG